jgi:hypothetical protein
MYPWFWVWAPQQHFPLSGGVAQQIDLFDSISTDSVNGNGNRTIEKKAFAVASYGKQLGLLTEILVELADRGAGQSPLSNAAAAALDELKAIRTAIKVIKDDFNEDAASPMASDIETQVRQLKEDNPAEFARLSQGLRALLAEEPVAPGETALIAAPTVEP